MSTRKHTAALTCILSMTVLSAHAVQIFYEDFEDPAVSGQFVSTLPTGWTSPTGSDAGLGNSTITGKTGSQYGWVFRNGGTLQITVLPHTLGAGTNYTLTCDVAFDRGETYATATLLAGTNVLAVSTNIAAVGKDLSVQDISMSFVAMPDNPHLGKPLGIQLSGDYWQVYFDELKLDATTTTNDFTPPTPTNMVWIDLPTSSVSNSITMMATNAIDVNGVEYFFTNTVNGSVSGWQDSQIWTDTDLMPKMTYSYKVKARDRSANLNETEWSPEKSARCEEFIILYESFETPSLRPKGSDSGFSDSKWAMPPAGWYGTTDNYQRMCLESGSTFPTLTPFGEQFACSRGGYIETTASGLGGHILEPEYTYRVTYNTGCAGERTGEESGVPGSDKVELYAGTVLVASTNVSLALDDFSETNSLVFIPDDEHPNLEEPLTVRFSKTSGQWWYHVIYDNIKVYAIPPPAKGTVLIIQ